MPIKRKGKLPNFSKLMTNVDDKIIEALHSIGEIAIKTAEEAHEFQNRTFNLEDSYAYAIYKDGKMVDVPIVRQQKSEDGEGHEAGINFLNKQNPNGNFSLVVTAGMWYGSIVQDYYLYDVLNESEFAVEKIAPKILKDIKWSEI